MLLSALFALATAEAAAPAWAWQPGRAELYHLETLLLNPRGVTYWALNNLDARASRVHVQADTTCTPVAVGKNLWEVSCTFAHLKLDGTAYTEPEEGELDTILAEWSTRIKPITVVMTMSRDGRVRDFDVEGLARTDTRSALINDQIRTLLSRSFSLFDLELPPEGDDWKRGWEVKAVTPVLQLQTASGTLGSALVKYTSKGELEGLHEIVYGGKATVSPGAAIDAGTGSLTFDTRIAGSVLWDMSVNLPAYRDVTVEGYRTASSDETGGGAEYAMVAALQRVDAFNPDGTPPLPIAAQRAPLIDRAPPDAPAGVPVVAFSELGMQPLYVPSFPPEARGLGLTKATVSARLLVAANGMVETATVYKGYAVLVAPGEQALRAARFPVRGDAAYVVDVEVEFRAE